MKLIKRILNETTCEGKTLDIYIKESNGTSVKKWIDEGTHQYVIVFNFNNVANPNYGFSYYIDTIMKGEHTGGLCLHGDTYSYASVSGEVMGRVKKFINDFVDSNKLNLDKG